LAAVEEAADAVSKCQAQFKMEVEMRFFRYCLLCLIVVLVAVPAWSQTAKEAKPAEPRVQKHYSSPEYAMRDLITAAKNNDRSELRLILGPDAKDLVSGDPVEEANELQRFSQMAEAKADLEPKDASTYVMIIGEDEWPFPIPIVKDGDRWRFNTKAGVKEVLARRIGRNELQAALVCEAYAAAQWDYFLNGDWDNDQVHEFAQKLLSGPGLKDGLYWPVQGTEKASPLGPLVGDAAAQGYAVAATAKNEPRPYKGYYYRILKAQGPSAPGGRHSYVVNGNMINGFALVAFPAKYGASGVMTFIINQQGRVYEKDLGPNTARIAGAMTEYNPDSTWTMVID